MARKPRVHYEGATYHIFNRGNGGKDTFVDEMDFHRFMDESARLRSKGFVVHAYALMPNHFHFVAQVGKIPLSDLMQGLLTRYASYFNYRRGTFGNVFQSRYKAKLIEDDAYLQRAIAYTHLNPIASRLVSEPEAWRWSGHLGLVAGQDQLIEVDRTLALFSQDTIEARSIYAGLMASRRRASRRERVPSRSQSLAMIAEDCCQQFLVDRDALNTKTRNREVVRCRRLFARRALDLGYQQAEIAGFLGFNPSAVSKMLAAQPFCHDKESDGLTPLS
jgi:putative transposase